MSLLNKLRNISESQVTPVTEPPKEIKEDKFEDLGWYPSVKSKSVYYLRNVTNKEKRYQAFFVHCPTLTKTRGFYRLIDKEDADALLGFHEEFKDYIYMNFSINQHGILSLTKSYRVPNVNVTDKVEFFNIYQIDNLKSLYVNDILDVLDFIHLLKGNIHMNPLKEAPKLTRKVQAKNQFRLGEMEDYKRPIEEFVTSQDKPTLSYRYIVKGFEVVDGSEIETRKFFSYPIIDNEGNVAVEDLEFTVPNTKENLYYINKYLGNFLVPHSLGLYKNESIYFIVDCSKLNSIYSIHEPVVTMDLVLLRERTKLILKSIKEFKSIVKNISKRIGTPIRELNMYTYDVLNTEGQDTEVIQINKTKYSSFDTKNGNYTVKKLLERVKIKDTSIIDQLIVGYLEGKLTEGELNKFIEGADKMYDNTTMREALKILFESVKGQNLKEMFQIADHRHNSLERMSNSLKMRLHIFREQEVFLNDFLLRALSQFPNEQDIQSKDYISLTFADYNHTNDNFNIELKTEIKIIE